jgi:hypothetical protein
MMAQARSSAPDTLSPMARPGVRGLSVLALAAALAGCGGKASAPPPAATTQGPPPLSATDRAACANLESTIRIVSRLVSGSVDLITESSSPKQLARRTREGERHLLYAARVLAAIPAPQPAAAAQRRLVAGLRRFAVDLGRAQRSVGRGDIAGAARQVADRQALAEVQAATTEIDRVCGD